MTSLPNTVEEAAPFSLHRVVTKEIWWVCFCVSYSASLKVACLGAVCSLVISASLTCFKVSKQDNSSSMFLSKTLCRWDPLWFSTSFRVFFHVSTKENSGALQWSMECASLLLYLGILTILAFQPIYTRCLLLYLGILTGSSVYPAVSLKLEIGRGESVLCSLLNQSLPLGMLKLMKSSLYCTSTITVRVRDL